MYFAGESPILHPEHKLTDRLWNIFTYEGNITVEDLGIVNKAFGQHISDKVLNDWIKESDSDGNEKIDFKEFIKSKIKNSNQENNDFYQEM